MTTITVASESGRVSVRDLPTLAQVQAGDRIIGVQGEAVGLFSANQFNSGGNTGTLDLSAYATTTALTQTTDTLNERINSVAASIPTAPDLSIYAKKSDIPDTSGLATQQQVGQAISGLNIPSIEGLAKQSDLTAEATARQNGDQALDQKIDQLRSTIPATPDLSG
ncbi:hypothetical protein, partial [Bombella saccharophila]